MAVFLMNVCKFEGCGITFRTLGDLIQHIEETHIDFDPRVLEKQESQQPPCIPISYVLRFFTDAAKSKDSLDYLKSKPIKRAHSPAVSACSTTPSGSDDFDDEDLVSESEDSNDSWTTQEEFSSEFIMRYGSRIVGNPNPNEEKPFACPVPGCKKRYKNINGIKYHAKNGHRKDARIKKAYRCHCGKSYKTAKGLRNHNHIVHYHVHNCSTSGIGNVARDSATLPGSVSESPSYGNGNSDNGISSIGVVDPSVHVRYGNRPSASPHTGATSGAVSGNCVSIGTQIRLTETYSASTPPPTPYVQPLPHGLSVPPLINQLLLPTTPPPTPTSSSAALSTVTTPTYAVCSPPPAHQQPPTTHQPPPSQPQPLPLPICLGVPRDLPYPVSPISPQSY